MNLRTKINEAVGDFAAFKLEQCGGDRLASFVLERTRIRVGEILDQIGVDDEFPLGRIEEICQAFEAGTITFAQPQLDRAGLGTFAQEIKEFRLEIKWKILIEELTGIVDGGVTILTPSVIRNLDANLFSALSVSLKQSGTTWDDLADYLPEHLAAIYFPDEPGHEEEQRIVDEKSKRLIEKLGIGDIVAGLAGDPKKLSYFLSITCSELTQAEQNNIVYVSFAGLRQARHETKLNRIKGDCVCTLEDLQIQNELPYSTDEKTVNVKVKVPKGAAFLLVRGPWNRDIKIGSSDELSFDVLLKSGETNRIVLLAYNEDTKVRSELKTIDIEQTGDSEDEGALVILLKSIGEDRLRAIQEDDEQKKLFRLCIEESLIKHFAAGFERGNSYAQGLKAGQNSEFVITVIDEIIELFKTIDAKEYLFLREKEGLLFFQKYCLYKIEEARAAGAKALILANEPGLGKTVTALTAVHDDETLIISPNAAASTWIEQAAKFFKEPSLTNIAGETHERRLRILASTERRAVVTNIEFLRVKDDGDTDLAEKHEDKIEALNRRRNPGLARVKIVDEAHGLKGDSQQTDGISLIEQDFGLYLSASPYRDAASFCKVMAKIYPEDRRFSRLSAFRRAFPARDPNSLKALYLMARPFVIRFLKSEVMPSYNPKLSLSEQPFCLPNKRHINPFNGSGVGSFTLGMAQEEAILEMFTDWASWTEQYDHYMPADASAKEDGIRASDNRLTKEHAYRQIVNHPKYVGSDQLSPKHAKAFEIIDKELEGGNKGVVFCRYQGQVDEYARMLDERGIKYAQFTGKVSKEKYKKDPGGAKIRYKVDQYENYVFENNQPVVANVGEPSRPMLALDYERLTFQKDPEVMVCLSTYSAGSQSVTFTAATWMIKDDLPSDCIEDYQTEDRIHRLDMDFPKEEVRYYNLIGQHSEWFLEEMKGTMVEVEVQGHITEVSAYDLYFKQGTLDQVHLRNLESQWTGFQLLNNGIATDPALVDAPEAFQIP